MVLFSEGLHINSYKTIRSIDEHKINLTNTEEDKTTKII